MLSLTREGSPAGDSFTRARAESMPFLVRCCRRIWATVATAELTTLAWLSGKTDAPWRIRGFQLAKGFDWKKDVHGSLHVIALLSLKSIGTYTPLLSSLTGPMLYNFHRVLRSVAQLQTVRPAASEYSVNPCFEIQLLPPPYSSF